MSEYLDASIVVKWFKEGEEGRKGSLEILERIKDLETDFVMSEYGLLELVRGLVKAGMSQEKIDVAFQSVYDMYEVEGLKRVPIGNVLYLSKDIEMDLNLYASDALHLASAIEHGCDTFWSTDKHFQKESAKRYMQLHGIELKTPV